MGRAAAGAASLARYSHRALAARGGSVISPSLELANDTIERPGRRVDDLDGYGESAQPHCRDIQPRA